jgi:arylsulfatase A-like enzyme
MTHAGDINLRTPIMDRMAAEGASFSRAYANCPMCTPSRGTIFSGRHAHAGPVQSFFDVIKPSSPTTATMLREAGYHTVNIGKWHLGYIRDQHPQGIAFDPPEYWHNRIPECHRGGFQDWYADIVPVGWTHFENYYYEGDSTTPTRLPGYHTDDFTNLAIKYLKEYDREEPLFMVLSPHPPHFPLEVPEKWLRWKYKDLVVRENFTDVPPFREWLAIYYGMIENLDWNIGRLLDAMRELPRFKDSLVVYFSDHGEFMGSHGHGQDKIHPHEESISVPAIFHRPGHIPARGQVDQMFSLVDMLPTTLGLLGLDVPGHCQGTDFSPALRGESFDGPDDVLIEMVGVARWSLDMIDWRGIVSRAWKYAFYEDSKELLFNLADDPYELNNLVESHPEKKAEMRALLLRRLDETRESYFHVLIEHGVQPEPTIDVGPSRETYQPDAAEELYRSRGGGTSRES